MMIAAYLSHCCIVILKAKAAMLTFDVQSAGLQNCVDRYIVTVR